MLQLFQKNKQTADSGETASEETKKTELSVFKDPFNIAHIEEIVMRYDRKIFTQDYVWKGRVKFKNGLTEGEQRTPECETWEQFMVEMKSIYDSLASK